MKSFRYNSEMGKLDVIKKSNNIFFWSGQQKGNKEEEDRGSVVFSVNVILVSMPFKHAVTYCMLFLICYNKLYFFFIYFI